METSNSKILIFALLIVGVSFFYANIMDDSEDFNDLTGEATKLPAVEIKGLAVGQLPLDPSTRNSLSNSETQGSLKYFPLTAKGASIIFEHGVISVKCDGKNNIKSPKYIFIGTTGNIKAAGSVRIDECKANEDRNCYNSNGDFSAYTSLPFNHINGKEFPNINSKNPYIKIHCGSYLNYPWSLDNPTVKSFDFKLNPSKSDITVDSVNIITTAGKTTNVNEGQGFEVEAVIKNIGPTDFKGDVNAFWCASWKAAVYGYSGSCNNLDQNTVNKIKLDLAPQKSSTIRFSVPAFESPFVPSNKKISNLKGRLFIDYPGYDWWLTAKPESSKDNNFKDINYGVIKSEESQTEGKRDFKVNKIEIARIVGNDPSKWNYKEIYPNNKPLPEFYENSEDYLSISCSGETNIGRTFQFMADGRALNVEGYTSLQNLFGGEIPLCSGNNKDSCYDKASGKFTATFKWRPSDPHSIWGGSFPVTERDKTIRILCGAQYTERQYIKGKGQADGNIKLLNKVGPLPEEKPTTIPDNNGQQIINETTNKTNQTTKSTTPVSAEKTSIEANLGVTEIRRIGQFVELQIDTIILPKHLSESPMPIIVLIAANKVDQVDVPEAKVPVYTTLSNDQKTVVSSKIFIEAAKNNKVDILVRVYETKKGTQVVEIMRRTITIRDLPN